MEHESTKIVLPRHSVEEQHILFPHLQFSLFAVNLSVIYGIMESGLTCPN